MTAGQGDRLLRPLVGRLTELTRELLDTTSVAEALDHIVGAACAVIDGADLASVTLRDATGAFHTPAGTEELALLLDRLQYERGEGPVLDAIAGGTSAFGDDLGAETAWPGFAAVAVEHGIAAVVATALLPHAQQPHPTGTLTVYSRRPGGLSAHDRDLALLLATHASLALSSTHAVSSAELRVAHLRRAVESRDVIGQAKGILMQRRGIDADEAFDVLRRLSQNLNVKLADLAQVLSARHTELRPGLGDLLGLMRPSEPADDPQ